MAVANKKQKMGAKFSNEEGFMVLEYDFANDGGAVGTIELADVDQKMIITQAIVKVDTACTSAGLATVAIGSSAGDPDAFMTITSGAKANLIADYTNIQSTGPGLVVAASETIDLIIGTAALTAGKIKVYLKYVNAA